MLSFKRFILEYLNDAQKNKVNSWLPDKKSGRIYSPKAEQISGHVIPEGQHSITIPAVAHTMREVHAHLDSNGFTNHNYAAGTTTDNHGRTVSIGKALEKTKAPDQLKNDFANDDRENAVDLEKHDIIISRHPYHVAEGSTNKPWKSCAGLTKGGGYCRYGGGAAARYLPEEIASGTHVAYLVPKLKKGEESSNAFPDIQKRIDKAKGRIYLKPHHSDQSDHTVLEPEDKVYERAKNNGGKNLGFLKSVKQFARKHFPMRNGEIYRKDSNVYNDDNSIVKFNTSDDSIHKILNSGDPRIKSELFRSKDLTHDQLHHLIDYHDDPEYDKNAMAELSRNKNLNKSHIDKLLDRNVPEVNRNLAYREGLHKSHVDRLVDSNDPTVHQYLIGNDKKDMLSKEHLHKIIDNSLSQEKDYVKKMKGMKNFSKQDSDLIMENMPFRNALRNIGNQKNLDSSHIDKIIKGSNSPYTHSDLIESGENKLNDDQLKAIESKWKDTDLSHIRNHWSNPYRLANARLRGF